MGETREAGVTPKSVAESEAMQIVAFRVGTELFGVDIHRVQEIIRDQHLTRVPNAPEFVEGVINLRGKIVPVVALRKRFGVVDDTAHRVPRIAVVALEQMIVGLAVDSVPEVLRVDPEAVMPAGVNTAESDYVAGIAKLEDRLVILINVERILRLQQAPAGEFLCAVR